MSVGWKLRISYHFCRNVPDVDHYCLDAEYVFGIWNDACGACDDDDDEHSDDD